VALPISEGAQLTFTVALPISEGAQHTYDIPLGLRESWVRSAESLNPLACHFPLSWEWWVGITIPAQAVVPRT
jgi:hypothetical protein